MSGFRAMRHALRATGLPLLSALAGAAMFGGAVAAGPGISYPDAPPDKPTSLCARAVTETEQRLAIPGNLLAAIALAESGRWDPASLESNSWPWTVYAEGHPHYPTTKKSAVAAVRSMMARGVRNIDVGYLQINLYYHPTAFASLDEAFDPAANAAYAGNLLLRLQVTHKSWSRAIAYYHSATRKYAIPYLRRVQRLWLTERRREATAMRDSRLESLRLEKAARDAGPAVDG